MLILRVRAPFAAFRSFVAGSYRPSAPFVTPSAAYGLVLNLAGIDSRFDDGQSVMTLMRDDLPSTAIALGMIRGPFSCSLYQQLHNYPITSKDKQAGLSRSKGGKYNVQPVRRELLVGVDAYVAIRDNDDLERQVREGLADGLALPRPDGFPRYGVPFLGDNNYLIDRIDIVDRPESARWYCRLRDLPRDEGESGRPGTCRLSIWIDRADMSQTVTDLYAPDGETRRDIPDAAWTRIPPGPGDA